MIGTFLTALPQRAVISMTGADARGFLQRVITHGPEGVCEGRALFSALLTPQGKILADFMLFDDGEGGLYVDAPASETDTLLKRFTLYRMRADARIEPRSDLAVIAAQGSPIEALKTVALSASPDPRAVVLGWRAIAPAGGPVTDRAIYNAVRIAAGVPEFGADYDAASVFSTDVNHDRLSGIDYKKGCFVGQEVASRMHRKGGVRKRTLRIQGDGLAQGAPLSIGEIPVGIITSTAGTSALALIRTDRLQNGFEAGLPLMAGHRKVIVMDDLT